MKILLITDLYPIYNSNDPKTILYFVQEWLGSGHTVDIIRANFIFNTLIRGKKLFKQQVISDENSKIYNLNFHTPFLFNVKNKLPKEFSIDKYDLVISHMPSGSILANKLIQNAQKPLICSVHASDIEVLTNPLYKFYFASE
jgi:UDP-N-acetylglucosamine transferase subunit ALG13